MADDNVQVKFGGDIANLQASIDKALSAIEGFSEGVVGVAAKFDILNAAFDKLKEYIEAPLRMEENFAKLGESIERTAKMTGLSIDQVQQFGFAVKMSGGDADSAAQSLLRFETNLGKAQAGAGPAAEAYRNMGISLQNADGSFKTVAQILPEVAEAFSKTADGAIKVEYATAIGSRGFAQLIPYLDKGKAGLEELNKRLDQTGGKMSDDMVSHSTDLQHSIIALDTSWTGLKNIIADDVAPAFKSMVDFTEELISGFNRLDQASHFHLPFMGSSTELANTNNDQVGGGTGVPVLPGQSKPTKQLPPLTGGGSGSDEADKEQSDEEIKLLDSKLANYKLDEEAKKLADETKVASGQMTEAQMLTDLTGNLQQQKAAAQSAFDAQIALYDDDDIRFTELQTKKLAVVKQYDNEIAQLALKSAQDQKKTYDDFFKSIQQGMDQMVNGILQGTQTWKQAEGKLFDDLALKFLDDVVLKGVLDWAKGEAQKIGITQAFNSMMASLGLAQASTAATTQAAANGAMNAAKVQADAALTYANVFANQSLLLGPAASVPAAASAAQVLAMAGPAAAYEAGTNYVPSTGLALLHQGEAVIPASQNTGGGYSNSGNSVNVTFNISAIDTQSGAQFLKNNMAIISQGIATSIRNGNNSLTSTARS